MQHETELLKDAVRELRQLRTQNQLMAARLEMFDSMMLLLTTSPNYTNQGMSPDLVYAIEKYLDSIKTTV